MQVSGRLFPMIAFLYNVHAKEINILTSYSSTRPVDTLTQCLTITASLSLARKFSMIKNDAKSMMQNFAAVRRTVSEEIANRR